MWKYGIEKFCNLEGQFIHIVGDLSHLADRSLYMQSICSLGVMGTKYVREGDPLPETIELALGSTQTLDLPHIYAKYAIGNTLKIDIRQAPSQPFVEFVSLTRLENSVTVRLDATSVPLGSYSLYLESYDLNSLVRSALKTDVIQIKVVAPVPESLPLVHLTVGSDYSWFLEDSVTDLLESGYQIDVNIELQLQTFVTFDQTEQRF